MRCGKCNFDAVGSQYGPKFGLRAAPDSRFALVSAAALRQNGILPVVVGETSACPASGSYYGMFGDAAGSESGAISASRPSCGESTYCLAGAPGFEPGNGGIKIRCLTTWLRPNTAREYAAGPLKGGAAGGP